MKTTKIEVKKRRAQRRAEIAASPHTKAAVQRLAKVSERAMYKWYAGVMNSKKIAAAHAALTNGAAARERQSA